MIYKSILCLALAMMVVTQTPFLESEGQSMIKESGYASLPKLLLEDDYRLPTEARLMETESDFYYPGGLNPSELEAEWKNVYLALNDKAVTSSPVEALNFLEDEDVISNVFLKMTVGFFEGFGIDDLTMADYQRCLPLNEKFFTDFEAIVRVFSQNNSSISTLILELISKLSNLINSDFLQRSCIDKLYQLKEKFEKFTEKIESHGFIMRLGFQVATHFMEIKESADNAVLSIDKHDSYAFGQNLGKFMKITLFFE